MAFNNNIISINERTPKEVSLSVAKRVRMRRLELNMTQVELSHKAGIPLPTYRKFERTGVIAFAKLFADSFCPQHPRRFRCLVQPAEISYNG